MRYQLQETVAGQYCVESRKRSIQEALGPLELQLRDKVD